MSTPRALRVAQSIKREMSEILRRDLKDERVAGVVSITDVECTSDCRSARIFVSIYGDDNAQQGMLDALKEHVGQIRGELCRRLHLRFAPELNFKLDKSLERGARVSELISRISKGEI
jgi:ribosome-binding factor A